MALPDIDFDKLNLSSDLRQKLSQMAGLKVALDEECGGLNIQIREIEEALAAISLGVPGQVHIIGDLGVSHELLYGRGSQGWRLYFDGKLLQECGRQCRIWAIHEMSKLFDDILRNANLLHQLVRGAK